MFSKKEAPIGEKIETIIGASVTLNGDLKTEGSVRVDGKFEGTIETHGDVIVGEKGKVSASIKSRHLLVAGQVKGNIHTSGKLEINNSGKLFGDVVVENIVIEDGALFQGNCTMNGKNVNGKEKKNVESAG